ncbi:hypothetical protein Nmel_016938 [Mimus melanotis]
MGDVVSTHLDEGRRQHIAGRACSPQPPALRGGFSQPDEGASGRLRQFLSVTHQPCKGAPDVRVSTLWHERTGKVLGEFCRCYKEQFGVALFNSVRYEIEGTGGPQAQLLHRKHARFSAGVTPKSGHSPMLKCPTDFPLILWHPYARHYYFCVMTGKEQDKWRAVFQDCVRHCNNGISEDSKVEAPAFTAAIRMYRQCKEQYGTWDMLCGNETQVLSNLVMEELLPELRSTIGPRLKGKAPERQRAWIQVSDAVYRMVYELAKAQYDAAVARCEQERPQLESTIRTDMDQIITSKEHLASKIRAFVLPKAEVCVRNHVQPYISSILEALMTPTSQGFAEVREVFFKEVTDMNMNVVNEGGLEKLVEYMEKLSHLAFHPVKMQSCYEKMDQLKLEGLQQRFDVSSTSVFKQRAQIHMRQQMDDAVYTFETLLHQELGKLQGKDDLCKSIQRILERVLKKFDYDSSTVRKKFFREALLQITIPFLLKKLAPTCKGELAKFQELIFEDFASFILVENTYEEVVLQSVMKDIMQGRVLWHLSVKEAAVQRKHNLYRDSMVMHNSDPNLHLLGEGLAIDWSEEYSGQPEAERRRRAKQVVSVIQDDEGALPYGAEALLQPGSPEARQPEEAQPGLPPVDAVQEIREALAQESLGHGAAQERLMNGTDTSGASEEGVLLPGAAQGDGTQQAHVPSEAEVPHATPRSSVLASHVPRADVPSEAEVPHVTPRSSVPASPVPGAEPPSVPHATAAAASPRAGVPAEAEVPHVTAAPPGAQSPSPACHQHGDSETGEHGERSPPQARASTESGEGVQTEF